MKVVNIDINRKNRIELGRRGEGNVRQIVFDCTYFSETYGSGTAQLLHRRRGDESPYPVLIEHEDNTVAWTVQEADTANIGIGEAELIWMLPDGNAKSAVYETETLRSLSEPGDPPEPWKAWVDAVLKAAESGGATPEQIASAVEKYLAEHPIEETDPTVPEWAKQSEKPIYTAEEVGADASGTAESKVSAHNVSDAAHNDIRLLVQGLTERLNALADSDDTTLDQMSEVVAYIKSNKSLIDAITTSKVNVSDIIDNLTTNASNKPLSAAQGVALKTMIDAIATVELDETLTNNTKAAPAGMVGELKDDLSQLSWDNIKNKPFYDNSWVLDTSNVLETNDINSDVGFVLISNNPDDFYLLDDDINYYGKYYYNTEHKLTISINLTYDYRTVFYEDDDGNETTICYVVRQENTSIDIYNAGTRYKISNPSIGIWVKHDPQGTSKKASIYTKDVHKIDPKFLPEIPQLTIVTHSDSDPNYATHSPAEIYEAFQSGNIVLFHSEYFLFQLSVSNDQLAVFSLTAAQSTDGDVVTNLNIYIDENLLIEFVEVQLNPVPQQDSMILNSSTDGSTKQFQITVDDSGVITATEVTE